LEEEANKMNADNHKILVITHPRIMKGLTGLEKEREKEYSKLRSYEIPG